MKPWRGRTPEGSGGSGARFWTLVVLRGRVVTFPLDLTFPREGRETVAGADSSTEHKIILSKNGSCSQLLARQSLLGFADPPHRCSDDKSRCGRQNRHCYKASAQFCSSAQAVPWPLRENLQKPQFPGQDEVWKQFWRKCVCQKDFVRAAAVLLKKILEPKPIGEECRMVVSYEPPKTPKIEVSPPKIEGAQSAELPALPSIFGKILGEDRNRIAHPIADNRILAAAMCFTPHVAEACKQKKNAQGICHSKEGGEEGSKERWQEAKQNEEGRSE